MAIAIIHGLVSNAAILLLLSFLYVQVLRRWGRQRLVGQVLNGVLFGGVAIGVMLTPLHLLPGVIFDTRSVVISVGGLFGGPLAAAITFLVTSAYRLWLGGDGALMGVLVSFTSAGLGALFHLWGRRRPAVLGPVFFYGFGLLVHAVMLVCALALPGDMTWRVLKDISLPVIIIYPVATLLIALLISDMRAQMAAERLVRESEERYRRIVSTANEGVWVVDDQLRTTFVNSQMAEMTGYGQEEMLGRPLSDFYFPDDLADLEEQIRLRRQGLATRYERRLRRKDGSERWAWVSAVPMFDGDKYTGSLAMYSDITERKRADEALKANEQRLQAILEASADPVVVYDSKGLTTFVNPAFTRVFGWSPEEVLGRRIPFVPDDQEVMTQEGIRQIQERGATLTMATQRLTKAGEPRDIVISAAGIPDASGKMAGMVVNLTDVTHTKRLEAQLRQSQKMEAIGTLAGGIAHDFNNILGAIMGYTELALETARGGRSNLNELGQVLRATDRARRLVKQILTFSRKAEADMKPLWLNDSVRQALDLLGPTLPKMISIETRLAPDLAAVKADPNQMEQVLLNLASNAADAMPEGGKLVIETRNLTLDQEYCSRFIALPPGEYVLLLVSDTGQGMDAQTLEHIFDPFFTTKAVGKGTGLGLATVYGIVKGHQGEILCYSEPGLGTSFKVYLPVHRAGAPGPTGAEAPDERRLRGSETILLVDDEEALRELGRQTLEGMGYQVVTADRGERALDLFKEGRGRIDLVVMDLGMPGMGGHKCLREILTIDPGARVVIASGYSANGQVKASLESGAAGYVAKPFRRIDLLDTVRQVLDR